jgi:hypothetical protein
MRQDGTPCKHACRDKTTCSHSCCKDSAVPPGNPPAPDFGAARDDGGDSPGPEEREKDDKEKEKDGTEREEEEEEEDGGAQFAKTLGKSLADGIALNETKKHSQEASRQRIKKLQSLDKDDVDDFDKVTDHLRNVESLATGSDYAVPIDQLAGSFPDEDVRNICATAINEQKEDGAMAISYVMWQAICMDIYTKLFGSPSKIMAKVNNGFADTAFKARTSNEKLEAYHRRFKLKLRSAMWIRDIFDKPNDNEWMSAKLEKYVTNLNSDWAGIHIMEMAAKGTLQDMFDKLQEMTRIKSLSDRDGASGGGSKASFMHMHDDRAAMIAEHGQDNQIVRAIKELSQVSRNGQNALFELKEHVIRNPVAPEKGCAHCPPHRAGTHSTADCFLGPNQESNNAPAGNNRARGAAPDFNGRGDSRTCFNCGKPGHISRDCRERKRPREGGGARLECTYCRRQGHTVDNCYTKRNAEARTPARDGDRNRTGNQGRGGDGDRRDGGRNRDTTRNRDRDRNRDGDRNRTDKATPVQNTVEILNAIKAIGVRMAGVEKANEKPEQKKD